MTTRLLKSLLYQWRSFSVQRRISGFTLVELLVGTVIAGIAVSGLLYMVTRLLQTNQQQSAQSETQRDMQTALDYINSELRSAVYVYSGDCIYSATPPAACSGLVNYIPAQTSSIPILAFWKLDPLPKPVQDTCDGGGPAAANLPCLSGKTYTLVVYFLSKDPGTANWQGKARITRYALSRYNSAGVDQSTSGYVDPNQSGVTFASWPLQNNGPTTTNLQSSAGGVPTGPTAVALVDFVDDTARDSTAKLDLGDKTVACPADYSITPNADTLTKYAVSPFDTDSNIRSFYACVRQGNTSNQDVFVFLRGNAFGRAGIGGMSDRAFLPTLQTQVLTRGVVNTAPVPLQ